jgi:hypothetical protein
VQLESQRLFAHRAFNGKWLVQLGLPHLSFDISGGLSDSSATARAAQRGPDPAHRQFDGGGRGGCDRQHGTRLRAGDTQWEPVSEGGGRNPSRRQPVPVSMMLPPKVNRSTIAAQSLGSLNVFVQHEKDLLEAIATLAFSSL